MFDKRKKPSLKSQITLGAVICLTLLVAYYYFYMSRPPTHIEPTKEDFTPKVKKPIIKKSSELSSPRYNSSSMKSILRWHKKHCRTFKKKKYCDPYFIIIGAPKCGTTSLFDYFLSHPNIFPPVTKELNFFNSFNYSKDYIENFEVPSDLKKRKDLITLEASANYIINAHTSNISVYERIANGIPDVKLVALLRNPVDRFMSHYNYRLIYPRNLPELSEKIELDLAQLKECYSQKKDRASCHLTNKEFNFDQNLVVKSIYIDKFRGLLKYFPKERLRVYISEKLFANSTSVLRDLHEFLDIPFIESIDFNKVLPKIEVRKRLEKNITKYSLSPSQRSFLCSFYRPFNEELVELLGFKEYPWNC